MNAPSQQTLRYSFFDRDAAAARARLETLSDALRRRGVQTRLGEFKDGATHLVALGVGQGSDAIVIAAARTLDGHYKGGGWGSPPAWMSAHLEGAWREIS